MNRSGHWRSRLTGTMLGQLQLATYSAVLLGFTGATSTGLLLSERSRLRVGEAELQAASASLANRLEMSGVLTTEVSMKLMALNLALVFLRWPGVLTGMRTQTHPSGNMTSDIMLT